MRERILIMAKIIMLAEGKDFVDPVPDIESVLNRSRVCSYGFHSRHWLKNTRSKKALI